MDLIYTDSSGRDVGYFNGDIDFEFGAEDCKNDFVVQSNIVNLGTRIYEAGTEVGGIIEKYQGINDGTIPKWTALTWRGILMMDIIEPPAGQDYYIASGDANQILRTILRERFGGFFRVPDEDAGLQISRYQFALRCRVGTGLMDMLAEYGYKLVLRAKKEPGIPVYVVASAEPEEVIPGSFNEDSPVKVRVTYDESGYTHIVGMGQGELQNRQRAEFYVQDDWSVGTTKHFTGFYDRTYYYNDASAESLEVLKTNTKKKLKEIMGGPLIELESIDTEKEYGVGDLVRVNMVEIGQEITALIARKIVTIEDGTKTVNYKVNGGN